MKASVPRAKELSTKDLATFVPASSLRVRLPRCILAAPLFLFLFKKLILQVKHASLF